MATYGAWPDNQDRLDQVKEQFRPISLELDGDYQTALQHLQAGRWDEAIQTLTALRERYPQRQELESLLEHAQIKASLEKKKPAVTRYRLPLQSILAARPGLMLYLRRLAIFVMILLAAFAVSLAYWNVIAPAQAERTRQAEQARLLQEGQQALAVGAYARAADSFRQLLAQVPDSIPAREGLALAEERLTLSEKYQAAMGLQQAGRLQEALEAFRRLEAAAPGYADVSQRIETLKRKLDVQRYYEEANQAYTEGRWPEAITAYEAVRNLDADFQRQEVTQRLFDSYRRQADVLITRPDNAAAAARQAIDLLNLALSLRPRDAEATTTRAQLYYYLEGYAALMAQQWDQAARHFEILYSQSPQFLGGVLASHLYQIYLEQGAAYEAQEEYIQAFERYRLAASLPVSDTSEARRRMEILLPWTIPTATPTPTPTPGPTPTPTAVPLPLSAYRGWIAFRTDRGGGSSVYVMRPDGSRPRPVSDPENFAQLEEREAYSPDGTRRVYNEGDDKSTPLYIWRYDVPPAWEHRRQLLDNSAINYQPAWSPQGNLIAFVSQKSGGDEIWVVSADEREEHPTPKRLTFNDWEWDKHPTWSPDSQYIAFWSNRETGRSQIWIMRADGSNPVNISRNEFNDWDPVWIK